jgi:hypothetical protein
MPRYSTRRANKPAKKRARKYPKRLPRDVHKRLRWAARGTNKDYEKLRQLAKKARASLPSHVDAAAYERLMHVDRLEMIEQIQAAEEHNVSAGWFLDAVNWLFDKVPFGNWIWPIHAAQSSINSLKGDGLNQVDEQYARLVGATGTVDERPYVIDHWKRQVQFDSSYISVFDNPDGHRVICVRGTQGTGQDIGEDILVGITGRSTNVIGDQLLQILAATPDSMVVDLAAHSLGTSLALQSYKDKLIYNAVHETYLYSPAYSPFLRGATDAYERDENVRYFINTRDAVSMGGMGHRAPANVVFRSSGNPVTAHKLAQWQGSSAYQDPIYHAPPETRVHAHKQVFPPKQSQDIVKEDVEPVAARSESVDAPRGVQPTATGSFDFGDVPEFDYGVW